MDEPRSRSLPPSYFEALYAANPDPWKFETSAYEAEKYAATLAALPRPRYRSGFEIGCSIGVLTAQLAARCYSLLAVDVVESALAAARRRCHALGNVRFALMRLPDEFPPDRFDLIVLSEVGYFWTEGDLDRARQEIAAHLVPGGHLVLVHWTAPVEGFPVTGDEVHARLGRLSRRDLRHLAGRREERYRLDLFERRR